jgi:hypothetical protein
MRWDVYCTLFTELLLILPSCFPNSARGCQQLARLRSGVPGQVISSSMPGVEMQPSYWPNTVISCGSMHSLFARLSAYFT